MPQLEQEEENDTPIAKRTRFASWWHNFHFSGRVIICSVLFGLGLILIGSLLFAINMNDDSKSKEETFPNDMPSKPPSNVIGPVVMGIGGFIVIVGIIMCLFETQVCRKKTGDASPLISEVPTDPEVKGLDITAVPSTSYSNGKHRQGRKSASPRKSKTRNKKSRSKEGSPKKVPITPPVSIATTKNFMTSSEDTFLTPPNTLASHTALVHSNSRDAENQTSSSLMKSFTSSGPSLNQSTEFQTPSTSFRDTSVSLENSVEIDENKRAHFNATELVERLHDNVGFMTPVTLEDEKIKTMSTGIQNQERELDNLQSKEMDAYFNKTENDILPDMNNTPKSARDLENIDTKSLQSQSMNGKSISKHKSIIKESISTEPLNTDSDTLTAKDCQTQDAEPITPVHRGGSMHDVSGENISEENLRDSLNKDTNEMLNISPANNIISTADNIISPADNIISPADNITSPANEKNSKIEDTTLKATLMDVLYSDASDVKENDIGEAQADLASSVSSDETVTSQDSVLEKHASSVAREELKENVIVETENLYNAESEKDAKYVQSNSIDIPKSESDIKNEYEARIHDDYNESNIYKENENKDKLPNDSS